MPISKISNATFWVIFKQCGIEDETLASRIFARIVPRFSAPSLLLNVVQWSKSDPISSFLFQEPSRSQNPWRVFKSHKVAQLKMSARFLEDLPLFFQRYITSKTLVWFSKSYSILKWTQVYFDQGKWTFHLGIFFKHLLWENRTQSFKVWRRKTSA